MAARAEKAQLDDLLAMVRAQKTSGKQAVSPSTKTALPPSASPGSGLRTAPPSGRQMVTSVPQVCSMLCCVSLTSHTAG